jgi:hypothetical protein
MKIPHSVALLGKQHKNSYHAEFIQKLITIIKHFVYLLMQFCSASGTRDTEREEEKFCETQIMRINTRKARKTNSEADLSLPDSES